MRCHLFLNLLWFQSNSSKCLMFFKKLPVRYNLITSVHIFFQALFLLISLVSFLVVPTMAQIARGLVSWGVIRKGASLLQVPDEDEFYTS